MANFNVSQFKGKMRSIQNEFNREMRKVERQITQGLNDYNRAMRQYDSKMRVNQAKIKSELLKMQRSSTVKTSYTISVMHLNKSYDEINQKYNLEEDNTYGGLLYKIEEENANNLEVANVLNNNDEPDNNEYSLEDTKISNKLLNISEDLDNRWRGAIFALNPKNPDATRHFCTSTREIFIQIIDTKAKEQDVFMVFPNCERTENGSVTRREKIKYLLYKKGIKELEIEEFIYEDIENILSLLYELNGGTHGNAGKYTINQLKSIKKRVEKSLEFLCECVI